MKVIIVLITCASLFGRDISNIEEKTLPVWDGKIPEKCLKHGIPVYRETKVDYKCNDGSMLTVKLKEPVVIGVAGKPEKWGYFQFPSIAKKPNNTIIASWNMNEDDIVAYGDNKFLTVSSKDNGKTWKPAQTETVGKTLLKNGDLIEIFIPKPIKVADIKLPKSVGSGIDNDVNLPYFLYRLNELPDNCQGIYINRLKKGETEWKIERATMI